MRLKSACLVLGAILLARGDARPQEIGTNESAIPEVENKAKGVVDDERNEDLRSRVDEQSNAEHVPNHYQYMDQSLRTVATQLLNVSQSQEMVDIKEALKTESNLGLLIREPERIFPPNSKAVQRNEEKSDGELNKKMNSGISSIDSMGFVFGRPVNSKFSSVEVGHPGHAMALTEEELEKELSESRLTTFQKNHQTTTGRISTWVLMNSPDTTPNPPGIKIKGESSKIPLKREFENATDETTMRNPESTFPTFKFDFTSKDLGTIVAEQKISTIQPTPKVGPKRTTTTVTEKTSDAITTPRYKSHMSQSVTVLSSSTTMKSTIQLNDNPDSPSSTIKTISSNRSTLKPKVTTPKSTTVAFKATTIKVVRPSQSNRPSKPNGPRKSSNKNEAPKSPTLAFVNSTSKIEKVTLKPVLMITTPMSKMESVPKPTFVTKVQANFQSDVNSKLQSLNDSQLAAGSFLKRANATSSTVSHLKFKSPKPLNVSKVQLKKQITDSPSKINIKPINMNAPVLLIEKVDENEKISHDNKDSIEPLDTSQIDVKFEFDPEVTNVETSSEAPISITKKPNGISKRKKHKHRRRNPSSISSSSSSTSNTLPSATSMLEEIAGTLIPPSTEQIDNSLQESKVVPEFKTPSNKNEKKQVAKPIGTQIYNYFSREVMPSFGVMSLVGLGLGLASYFLYPFSGTIARRNYEVDPNYKYNIDEYDGNYGQKEEEIFSKVLQGMTLNDAKYGGIKDYEQNHDRYQVRDRTYRPQDTYTKKRSDSKYPASAVSNYRPGDLPPLYNAEYRNTELNYLNGLTTPSYYEHQHPGLIANQGRLNIEVPTVGNPNGDRRFVVGNVPKEYPRKNMKNSPTITTESFQTDFEMQIAQGLEFSKNPLHSLKKLGQTEAEPMNTEGFDEIEIAPSAVAVEHGPRSLNFEELEASLAVNVDVSNEKLEKRIKRDSVIQLIPSRTEIAKEEYEEDFSNEILDIIDSALPNDINGMEKKNTEVDELEVKMGEPDVKVEIKEIGTTDEPREELSRSSMSVVSKANESEIEQKNTVTTNEVTTSEANLSSSSAPTITIQSTGSNTLKGTNSNVNVGSNSENTTFGTIQQKPDGGGLSTFNFVKKIAEIKFRLGLTILKHASESFARYLGQVQKKINGE